MIKLLPCCSWPSLSPLLAKQTSRPLVLLLLVLLVWMQYLNLLQSKDGVELSRRHRRRMSAQSHFTFRRNAARDKHKGNSSSHSFSVWEMEEEQLLTPVAKYLADRVSSGQEVEWSSRADIHGGDVGSVPPPSVSQSCPLIPPSLHGPVKVLLPDSSSSLSSSSPSSSWPPSSVPLSMAQLESWLSSSLPSLEAGGRMKPSNCSARHKVAIIVPYRDREQHLRTFLANIHPFLAKQQVC